MIKETIEIMTLPCVLSVAEKARYADQIFHLLAEKQGFQDSLKTLKDKAKSVRDDIENIEDNVADLASLCKAGEELRLVQVKKVIDLEEGEVTITRMDTGEIIERRIVNESDKAANVG